MLKRFGYTNIALLVASTVIILTYVDFKNLSTFDYVLLVLYGITLLIHIIRLLILFMSQKKR